MPLDLESVAPPSLPEDFPNDLVMDTKAQADHVAGNASYRFLDGAFSDHAAAAATLSTMITYCEARPGLCDDEPIKLLLVGTDTNSSRAFFAGAIPANTFGPGQYPAYQAPSRQLFDVSFPEDPAQWPVYATVTLPEWVLNNATADEGDDDDALFPGGHVEWVDVESTYWHGEVTTVGNEWWNVPSGWKVDLLMFHSNWPGLQTPIIAPSGKIGQFIFKYIYAPLTASQAAGAQPVIAQWLAGTLPATP